MNGWMEERLGEKEAYESGVAFLDMVRRVFQDERKFRELLCILKDYPSKRIDFKDFITLVKRKLLGHKELILEFSKFLPQQINLKKSSTDKHKELNKPISELNFSKWENITPSYWKFPSYLQPNVKGRTEADASVLNDDWVLIAPKENRNFRILDKDPVEEAELETEDQRYRIDRRIEQLKTTISQVEWLLECLKDADVDHGDFYIQNFLTASSMKCIIDLYAYRGLEAINNILMDARKTLPIILASLIVKHDEWIAYKSNFKEIKRKRRKPNSQF